MSALAELIRSLPAWVRWGPSLFYPTLAVGTLLPLTWALEAWLLRPLRRLPEGAHWSERARAGFPARMRLVSWALTSTAMVGLAWVLWLGRLTPLGVAVAPSLATLTSTVLAATRVARLVAPARPHTTVRGLAGLLMLGWGQLAMLFVLAVSARDGFDATTWLILALALAASALWALGIPAALALATGLFEPPGADVAALVVSESARLGVRAPRVSVAELPTANAFALVPGEHLILTRALIAGLTPAELETVVAHELEHLREAPLARRLRVVSSLAIAPLVLLRPLFGVWGLPGTLLLALSTILVVSLLAWVRHRLERSATAGLPPDPTRAADHARMLERIYEIHGIPAVMRGAFSRGSSLYDRMLAAGAAPSFARPDPPPRALVPLLVCFALALTSLVGARVALMWAERRHGERLSVIHCVLAATGGDAGSFEQLGYARFLAGDVEGATLAYAAAAELEPDAIEPRALVARLRILSGDCSGAVVAAWDASVVAERAGSPRDRDLVRSIRRELDRCEGPR
ncbi:MAG: M48 family metalloprotease [Deltaproteobacteria bacterium]